MQLKAENIKKQYGKRTVVQDVSFEVNQGEIVGLLGPNGAGKTTSFYMVTGLVQPNAGRVLLDEEEITNLAMYQRAKRGVGYLPQEASVFRSLSVEDNIKSVLELTKLSKTQQKEKLEQLLTEFGLTEKRKFVGHHLSGGERRRTETLSITDRAYLLFEGRILKAGSPKELAEDEQVRRVYLGQHFKLRE